jgi:hypothetical protein
MNEFIFLFGDRGITEKENDGNFAPCAPRNDAVSRHFFRVIIHHQTNRNKFIP